MPSLLAYVERFGALPRRLTFSLAALMAFYTGREIRENALIGSRDGAEYKILDDMNVLEFFLENGGKDSGNLSETFLGHVDFFGQDLNRVEGLTETVAAYLEDIRTNGMRAALCRIS